MSGLRRAKRRGISVLEILIAMTIFATAFLMLFGIFPTGLRSVQQARELSMATHIAELELEQMRALPYAQLTTAPAPPPVTVTTVANGQESRVQFTVQRTAVVNTSPDTTTVQVQVTWETGSGFRFLRMETEMVDL